MEHLDITKSVILPYINFIIFIVLAIKFMKSPLRNLAEQDKENFEALKKQASEAKESALKQKLEYEEKMKGLNEEIAKLKASLKSASEIQAQEMIEHANMLAESFKKEADRVVNMEVENALMEIRKEITSKVYQEVQNSLSSQLNEAKNIEIVNRNLDKISKIKQQVTI